MYCSRGVGNDSNERVDLSYEVQAPNLCQWAHTDLGPGPGEPTDNDRRRLNRDQIPGRRTFIGAGYLRPYSLKMTTQTARMTATFMPYSANETKPDTQTRRQPNVVGAVRTAWTSYGCWRTSFDERLRIDKILWLIPGPGCVYEQQQQNQTQKMHTTMHAHTHTHTHVVQTVF